MYDRVGEEGGGAGVGQGGKQVKTSKQERKDTPKTTNDGEDARGLRCDRADGSPTADGKRFWYLVRGQRKNDKAKNPIKERSEDL